MEALQVSLGQLLTLLKIFSTLEIKDNGSKC